MLSIFSGAAQDAAPKAKKIRLSHAVTSDTPALDWAVREDYVSYGPDGYSCEDCPFALEGPSSDTTFLHPFDYEPGIGWNGNTDRSEAWFKCGLPGSKTAQEKGVWGEYPKCTEQEWRAQARAELYWVNPVHR